MSLRHRGPDGFGQWSSLDNCVHLAHRRLAVIDLSEDGNQPMIRGRHAISFNGEIYNYQELREKLKSLGVSFRGRSDTEVILAAYEVWGSEGLEKLDGMFAIALYDGDKRQLHLIRDRTGEKPLFYYLDSNSIRFASELKALLQDQTLSRVLNRDAFDCYLGMGFVPGERCLLDGFYKLPPAHRMVYDVETGKTRSWRYWSLPEYDEATGDDFELLVEELESKVADSVRLQLTADVPVGVLLSGGVDSSIIAALASRFRQSIKTFTVRFPDAGKFDESKHAQMIANHFSTDHMVIEADPITVNILPKLAQQFDEPIIDSSMVPMALLSQQVRNHCTVALGGDGADELFGGYRHYQRLVSLREWSNFIPLPLRRGMSELALGALPIGFPGLNWLSALRTDFDNEIPLIASYFTKRQRDCLRPAFSQTPNIAGQEIRSRTPRSGDLIQRATRLDFNTYLPEDILVKLDRASMLYSLEIRAPFLARNIIEFAFSAVPSIAKSTRSGRKLLLRGLARRLLPPEFDSSRKQGFSVPLYSWLSGSQWGSFFREVLLDHSGDFLDKRIIENLFAAQRRGWDNSEKLFGLVMLELWRREYRVQS
jgi:asparagine synthase (glutamine-hydrolysing)